MLQSISSKLPIFQSKVADCLLKLGKIGKSQFQSQLKPNKQNDTLVGEEIYLSHIRPICVQRYYVPQRLPTSTDLQQQNISGYFKQIQKLIYRQRKVKSSHKIYENDISLKQEVNENKNIKKGGKAYQNLTKQRKLQQKKSALNDKFFADLDIVLSTHLQQKLQTFFGFSQSILQIKLMTFLYMRWYFDENYEADKVSIEQIYQCIHILIRVIKSFQNFSGAKYNLLLFEEQNEQKQNLCCSISCTLILDLKLALRYMIEKYKYQNSQIIFNYPRLAYDNKYNSFFPSFDTKPYESQIKAINAIKNSIDAEKGEIKVPKLVVYNTMIGTGKTSFVLSLVKLIDNINQKIPLQKDKLKILYACEIASVRIQLARLVYNKDLKFVMTKKTQIKRGNKVYQYTEIQNVMGIKSSSASLVISDWQLGFNALDKHEFSIQEMEVYKTEFKNRKQHNVEFAKLDPNNTILFVDEPTYACYDSYSETINKLFRILSERLPKITILASATMPCKQQLSSTFKLLQRQRQNIQLEQIKSKEFQIGCQLSTLTGKIFYPHTGVSNKSELLNIIRKLQCNPFLMRMYTGTSLYYLLLRMKRKNLQLPQFGIHNCFKTLTYKDFPLITFSTLKILSNQTDQIIAQICQFSQYQQANYNPYDEVDSDEQFFSGLISVTKKNTERYVNFNRIMKEDARKFLGGCLIATSDPYKFAETYLKSWVKKIPPLEKWINQYTQTAYELQQQLELIRGKVEQQQVAKRKILSRSHEHQFFPAYKKVNTIHHYKHYMDGSKVNYSLFQKLNLSKLINPVPIDSIQGYLNGQIEQWILKLLLCGVGLYSSNGLPKKYLDKVEELASANQLAFIVSDKSLCYGVSFPLSNVIILDDLITQLTMNEVFQLMGRTGRVGRSWSARTFMGEQGLNKLIKYLQQQDIKIGNEAQIFQDLAEYYMNNPELKLRTIRTQIRFNKQKQQIFTQKEQIQWDQLQIQIKTEKINISYLSFIVSDQTDTLLFTNKINLQANTINYYECPFSPIFVKDIPTILNRHQEPIIDIAGYYKNEETFINKIINNATKRVMMNYFNEQQIQNLEITNEFKINDENLDYMNNEKHIYCVFVKFRSLQIKQVEIKQTPFKFNNICANQQKQLPHLSYKSQKFMKILSGECHKLIIKLKNKGVANILAEDIKIIKCIQKFIRISKKYSFYKDFYQAYLPLIQQKFTQATKNIENKDSLLYQQEIKIAIFMASYIDLSLIIQDNFYIDEKVRNIDYVKDKFIMNSKITKQLEQKDVQQEILELELQMLLNSFTQKEKNDKVEIINQKQTVGKKQQMNYSYQLNEEDNNSNQISIEEQQYPQNI